jgi:HD domain
LPLSRRALAYAERVHAGQRRQVDGEPFIRHPIEVAELLRRAGAADHVIAAGILHDALEKSDATVAELADQFGQRVTSIVLAVTEDPQISGYGKRKAAVRAQAAAAGDDALTVLAADKISKTRELSRETTRLRGDGGSVASRSQRRRFKQYRDCLRLLEREMEDAPLVAQLRAELDRLRGVLERRAAVSAGAG